MNQTEVTGTSRTSSYGSDVQLFVDLLAQMQKVRGHYSDPAAGCSTVRAARDRTLAQEHSGASACSGWLAGSHPLCQPACPIDGVGFIPDLNGHRRELELATQPFRHCLEGRR